MSAALAATLSAPRSAVEGEHRAPLAALAVPVFKPRAPPAYPPSRALMRPALGGHSSFVSSEASPRELFKTGSLSSGSLHSAETLTPESSNGGRPSFASFSCPSAASVCGGRLAGGWQRSPCSAGTTPGESLDSGEHRFPLQAASYSGIAWKGHSGRTSSRYISGDCRRRRYRTPSSSALEVRHHRDAAEQARTFRTSLSTVASSFADDGEDKYEDNVDEVVIEGPLERRVFGFLWRPRWCVLTRSELRLYANEDASLWRAGAPLEQHKVASLELAADASAPSAFQCLCVPSRELAAVLRTGPGTRWEELTARSLWLRTFSAVSPNRDITPRRA